jgi:hypothetical protein
MQKRIWILIALSFTVSILISVATAVLAVPSALDDPLATLKPSHPRLIILDDQIKAVQKLTGSDATAADALRRLKIQADKMVDQPPVEHVLIGPRMLAQSRQALSVISTTAGLYRLTGDVRYAERAKKEMLTAAAFADWNPSHFLDVAEMTNACGMGYDWIYDQLSPEDRKTIRQAIVDKGLKPALEAYKKKAFWTDCSMNWGQVCGGGLTVGALAIAEDEPALAKQILQLTYPTMARPMREFAPDGGWDEGPGYWSYATEYNVFYLAAVESALGTDFGLEKDPGFAETPLFHMALTGPIGKVFNFADAGDGSESSPQMFWFARRFNRPEYAAWERAQSAGHFNIFHLLWFDPDGQWPDNTVPSTAVFKRVNVGVMRSNWADRNAWYVAFKGGDNAANHSHLDLGSFVLDAMGQRWALDLGPDNYNLPGYFGKQRFTYYRLSTRAHNTITIDGANQNTKARAAITSFVTNAGRDSSTIIDLSAACPNIRSARRGIEMFDGKRVLVQDEIDADDTVPVEWNFHTLATVRVDGGKATLSLGKARLRATILSPADAKFETSSAEMQPPQKLNTGVTDLMVRSKGKTTIVVVFSAVDDATMPAVKTLADWAGK